MAGGQQVPAIADVYQQQSALSPYGLAFLGLALEAVKDGRASEIAAALKKSVQQDGEQASWTATRDAVLDFSEDASLEATAFAVKFLSRRQPSSPILSKAALWLMIHRNTGGTPPSRPLR
jgi:hypothetical protein